jgi:AmmeMemoRadiSam system protein A
MSSLADREKQLLLETARCAVVAAVKRENPPEIPEDVRREPRLLQPGGAFVTLLLRGRLRGCIGQLESGDPLVEVVAHCARSSALEDPRFRPLKPEELPETEIELSVLSSPEDMRPEAIEAGKHGLIVANGQARGLLLPQVATQFRWNGIRLLQETCEKAGLPRDAWKSPGTRVQGFTADVFSEKEMAGH